MTVRPGGLKLTHAERVALLEERLGVTFSRKDLALAALCHKSWINEHPREALSDNERLEFLGDAVVDLAVGQRLMEQMPGAHEGELSRARASLVNEEGLGKVAQSLGLGELILLGKGEDRSGGRTRPGLLSDALEAVLGALYTGDGLPAVLALVDRLFAEPLAQVVAGRTGGDFKSLLQEWAQERLKVTPRYQVTGETGPEHAKRFEVEVLLGDAVHARAEGRNKKEAEQAAAQKTYLALSRAQPPGE